MTEEKYWQIEELQRIVEQDSKLAHIKTELLDMLRVNTPACKETIDNIDNVDFRLEILRYCLTLLTEGRTQAIDYKNNVPILRATCSTIPALFLLIDCLTDTKEEKK